MSQLITNNRKKRLFHREKANLNEFKFLEVLILDFTECEHEINVRYEKSADIQRQGRENSLVLQKYWANRQYK